MNGKLRADFIRVSSFFEILQKYYKKMNFILQNK